MIWVLGIMYDMGYYNIVTRIYRDFRFLLLQKPFYGKYKSSKTLTEGNFPGTENLIEDGIVILAKVQLRTLSIFSTLISQL